MYLGFVLLYVGMVLFLNGLWLLGKVDDRDIAVANFTVGLIVSTVVLVEALIGDDISTESINSSAITLLFGITYFWVGINRITKADGRGLGWFSLFVSITLLPVIITSFSSASGFTIWLAINWVLWCILWFMYFLLLALQKNIGKLTGWATLFIGIGTGWVPGMLILFYQ